MEASKRVSIDLHAGSKLQDQSLFGRMLATGRVTWRNHAIA
jgi:hypothetical protein